MDSKRSFVVLATCLLFSYSNGDVWLSQCAKLNKSYNGTTKKMLIYPGTKWCGVGSTAKTYFELGKFAATDSCCREHDHCDERIYSHQTKYGLTNEARHTRMLCRCDAAFYFCLKNVSSHVSRQVGVGYFDLLANRCFAYKHPIVRCIKRSKILKRCLDYELDASQPEKWQWFDDPLY